MDNLFVLRGRLQEMYARHSRIFDKTLQFLLALVTFFMINSHVGFMKMLAQPTITLALAVICTFFPVAVTILAATLLILAHMYAASLGILLVTVIVFFVMYAFYLRLTPKKTFVVLITPLAFVFQIPYVIPIACALVSGPATIIAILCGMVVFYMMQYVKTAAAAVQGSETADLMTQASLYIKHVFKNRQMWIVIVAFIICYLLVYTIRKQSLDHAWKIAIASGMAVNIIVIATGNIVLGNHTAYGSLIIGSVLAVIIGLVLEFFLFSVDYTKSENLQFEDDEYYYYVKAVPKLTVSTQEKTIKRINVHQELETADDEEEFHEKGTLLQKRLQHKKRPQPVRGPKTKKQDIEEVERMLLKQSLKKELGR